MCNETPSISDDEECAATLICKLFQQVLIKQENGNIITSFHLMCVMFSSNARGSCGEVKLETRDSFISACMSRFLLDVTLFQSTKLHNDVGN